MYPLKPYEPTEFKDSQNRYLTKGMFIEYSPSGIFTLGREDKGDIPSLFRLYMEMEDLTEYEFANAYFEDWDHWVKVSNSFFVRNHVAKWRTELEMALKAKALRKIKELSQSRDKGSFEAQKYILSKGWIDKEIEKNRRGRPSKQEVLRAAAEEAFSQDIVRDAEERLKNVTVQ